MRTVLLLSGLILASINPYALAQAEELQLLRIGTGGIAGTYYPIGGMIAHAVSNPPGDRPCELGGSCGPPGLVAVAQSANGSVGNVADIHQQNLESGFVQSDVAYWAYTGTGSFTDSAPYSGLRSIANLYQESIHLVTRKNAGIYRVRDLIGKRVSLGEPGSGTLIDAQLVLAEYGIRNGDIEAEYSKPDLAIERIRRQQLDAFFFVAGYPTRAVSELAADTEIELLPIDGPEAERLISRYRFFARDDIPAGIYRNVAGVETISVGAQWLVANSVDAELVYGITKTLWSKSSRKLLDEGHAKGKQINLDTALQGIAVPLHPGAARYYNEIGISIE